MPNLLSGRPEEARDEACVAAPEGSLTRIVWRLPNVALQLTIAVNELRRLRRRFY